jgi:hypothetical protein
MSKRIETIIAPYVLRPGQNFYLQQPFERILPEIVRPDFGLPGIRTALSKIVASLENDSPGVETYPPDLLHQALYQASKKQRQEEVNMTRYSSLNQLIQKLLKYPGIIEYIGTQMSPGAFSENGTVITADRSRRGQTDSEWDMVNTYAWWAARRQTRLFRTFAPGVREQEILPARDILEMSRTKNDRPFLNKEWLIMVND